MCMEFLACFLFLAQHQKGALDPLELEVQVGASNQTQVL